MSIGSQSKVKDIMTAPKAVETYELGIDSEEFEQNPESQIDSEQSNGVKSRINNRLAVSSVGTEEGLVVRVDGGLDYDELISSLSDFFGSRRSFLAGNRSKLILEWFRVEPPAIVTQSVVNLIKEAFGLQITEQRFRNSGLKKDSRASQNTKDIASHNTPENISQSDNPSTDEPVKELFTKVEGTLVHQITRDRLTANSQKTSEGKNSKVIRNSSYTVSSPLLNVKPAGIVYQVLRSGQLIEVEGSLILVGDVNSGAKIVAGGDIFVLGALRGVAHAGAYDQDGAGAIIFALTMAPTQLRIGGLISRGGGSNLVNEQERSKESLQLQGLHPLQQNEYGTEFARVVDDAIVVEAYQSKEHSHIFSQRPINF